MKFWIWTERKKKKDITWNITTSFQPERQNNNKSTLQMQEIQHEIVITYTYIVIGTKKALKKLKSNMYRKHSCIGISCLRVKTMQNIRILLNPYFAGATSALGTPAGYFSPWAAYSPAQHSPPAAEPLPTAVSADSRALLSSPWQCQSLYMQSNMFVMNKLIQKK